MKTKRINCYWLTSRRSLRKQNTRQLKISGKRFSKRVLTIFIILQFPFCNNLRIKRFPSCLYSVFWVLLGVWGYRQISFLKTHIERLNTENEKKSFVYSEQRSMTEREAKSSPFCFTNQAQASCMDVSRGRKQTTKSGQCHPGYKGKHCETRRWWDCSRKVFL